MSASTVNYRWLYAGLALTIGAQPGCRTVSAHRAATDRAAAATVAAAQRDVVGRAEPIVVESAADTLRRRLLEEHALPRADAASLGVHAIPVSAAWEPARHLTATGQVAQAKPPTAEPALDLTEALRIAARNSREYQAAKEALFREALRLNLTRDDFRHTFSGALSAEATRAGGGAEATETTQASGELGLSRRFLSGLSYRTRVAVDLVKLLTQDAASSLGLLADASISIPLLRGSGRLVAGEPVVQAERDMQAAVLTFERFKRVFAVRVATAFFGVLREAQQVQNAEQSYRRLVAASERTRRLADAGRLPGIQYDQTVQDELRARTRWITAQESYAGRRDQFNLLLGLPPDAQVTLDRRELVRLGATGTGGTDAADPPPDVASAVRLALERRLDLRRVREQVTDATRHVTIAADALRAEVTLLGSAQVGSRRSGAGSAADANARLEPRRGTYGGLLTVDLPFERTAEATAYRESLLALEAAVRELQELEDRVKVEVRAALRELARTREELLIQRKAVALAEKRVASTDLFLQAGRVQVRDALEAQEALVTAQNALTSAEVDCRLAGFALLRDTGQLEVSVDGLWNVQRNEESSE
jgi:outer membrane protein TolC